MQIKIREANAADADGIGYVHYNSWMETYTGLIHADFLATRSIARSTDIFRQSGCRNTTVATADGRIIGFCGYGKARDADVPDFCGEIHGIYVLRPYQHDSIGKRLLEYAKDQLREQGCTMAYLWVLQGNTRAIQFYERNGFYFDGKEKEETLVTPILEKRYACDLRT